MSVETEDVIITEDLPARKGPVGMEDMLAELSRQIDEDADIDADLTAVAHAVVLWIKFGTQSTVPSASYEHLNDNQRLFFLRNAAKLIEELVDLTNITVDDLYFLSLESLYLFAHLAASAIMEAEVINDETQRVFFYGSKAPKYFIFLGYAPYLDNEDKTLYRHWIAADSYAQLEKLLSRVRLGATGIYLSFERHSEGLKNRSVSQRSLKKKTKTFDRNTSGIPRVLLRNRQIEDFIDDVYACRILPVKNEVVDA